MKKPSHALIVKKPSEKIHLLMKNIIDALIANTTLKQVLNPKQSEKIHKSKNQIYKHK